MNEICLLTYLLPHVSLCDFIHYMIKCEFATNNNPGVSQNVDIFLPSELICLREYLNSVANNIINDGCTCYHGEHGSITLLGSTR